MTEAITRRRGGIIAPIRLEFSLQEILPPREDQIDNWDYEVGSPMCEGYNRRCSASRPQHDAKNETQPIGTPLGAILSISNKRCIKKSSSKAQIAAYLLMILAMAERGD